MAETDWATATPDAALAFWCPEDRHWEDPAAHAAFWLWRMRGDAEPEIRARFTELTEAAARGRLDHWAATPRGRLALVVVLDQFSRAVWRDTAAAYSQDIKAARLVLDAFDRGHYEALSNGWERTFCLIAVGHCEGPDHAARMARIESLAAEVAEAAPPHLRLIYRVSHDQTRVVREVIDAFGRHPHRNAVLGRRSTDAEEAYIAAGRFPHQRAFPTDPAGIEAMLAARECLTPAPSPG